jgi:GxxExxY protein
MIGAYWSADLATRRAATDLHGIPRKKTMELDHKDVTERIIGASFEVFRELGYGFLERVYQRAMKVELELRGLKAEIETDIQVRYKGQVVGDYRADILVNRCVLVELKVASAIDGRDEAQLLNELRATGIKVGLLINFGKQKAEFKRLVF